MHAPRPTHRSIEFARERDARILWLLESHPVTAAMLVGLGWFPSRNKALKRLRRLAARKRIRCVGSVARTGGRPEHVYCRWRPKPDQLQHEVGLTELCLRLHAGRILRGPHVTDRRVLPDAEVWIGGVVYYLEFDRGTMSYQQIVRVRFRKYRDCPHLCLWVCSSDARREGLRARAEPLRSTALFAAAADALATPHGSVWIDFGGRRASLPREVAGNLPGQKAGQAADPFRPPASG
jgi:hypothetical protein